MSHSIMTTMFTGLFGAGLLLAAGCVEPVDADADSWSAVEEAAGECSAVSQCDAMYGDAVECAEDLGGVCLCGEDASPCLDSAWDSDRAASLELDPPLPTLNMKSKVFSVQVRRGPTENFQGSYVYQYDKDNGLAPSAPSTLQRDSLAAAGHWTKFSFSGGPLEIRVRMAGSKVKSFGTMRKVSGLKSKIKDGDLYLYITAPNKEIDLVVNGKTKHPLYIDAMSL